jgi:hypothetical protein
VSYYAQEAFGIPGSLTCLACVILR